MTDPTAHPDPARALWAAGPAGFRFTIGDAPEREPDTATGRALVAALRAAGLGGTPITTEPEDHR